MASLEELKNERLKKLNTLKEKGIDPYPSTSARDHSIGHVFEDFDKLAGDERTVVVAGRVMALRGQGALIFGDVFDGTGRIQVLLKKDEMDEKEREFFMEVADIGDFIEFSGKVFVTNRGEKTLQVAEWKMLAKSLQPLPDKWHGLTDEDEKYRKRYLDILLNDEVADMFRKKSKFWNTIRTFLLSRDFVEVETPVLENTTGGAEAAPFVTHHNALDIDVYLRISAGELWQKRLMVAGMPRVFEIGRIFRNEGMSNEHLQDYTQVEFYQAYSDFRQGMEMIKELYATVAHETFGTTKFTIREHEVDFAGEWDTYNFVDMIRDAYDIDALETTQEEVVAKLDQHSITYDPKTINVERGIDTLWKAIRKTLSGPGFLINVPVYLEPLAKRSADDPRVVERFQVLIAGSEVGKGFSELNDPIDQQERFAHQQALRDAGDDEAQMADADFVTALEHGMPPTFGFGVSERLFSFLMDKNVRDTQIFPLMRPRIQGDE